MKCFRQCVWQLAILNVSRAWAPVEFSPRIIPPNCFPALGTVECFPRLDTGCFLCLHITPDNFSFFCARALGKRLAPIECFPHLAPAYCFPAYYRWELFSIVWYRLKDFPRWRRRYVFLCLVPVKSLVPCFFLRWALRHFYWVGI